MSRVSPFDLFDDFDRLYGGLLNREPRSVATRQWQPPVDIHDAGDGYVIEMDVPGLGPGDVDVSVVDDVLTVRGGSGDDPDRSTWIRAERHRGEFARQFRLPAAARADELEARVANGVLQVRIPHATVAEPTRIKVT